MVKLNYDKDMNMYVKSEDFLKWVIDQPDDRKLDMHQNLKSNDCGCVMVQYAKDRGFKFTECLSRDWVCGCEVKYSFKDFPLILGIDSLVPLTFTGIFGDLKEKANSLLDEIYKTKGPSLPFEPPLILQGYGEDSWVEDSEGQVVIRTTGIEDVDDHVKFLEWVVLKANSEEK